MKTFVRMISAVALLVAVLAVPASADNLKPIMAGGGALNNNARLELGNYPGAYSTIAVPMSAMVAITVGMAVKPDTAANEPAGQFNNVSVTTSACNQDVLGIALNTAAAGGVVYVAVAGVCLARFSSGTTTTAGVKWSGTTAGDLTPTAACTESGFTNLSRTSTIVYALENRAVSSSRLARALIVR